MKFRIVRDHYAGYEVQAKRWWWPFWIQCGSRYGRTNTHLTVEKAREFIEREKTKVVEVIE